MPKAVCVLAGDVKGTIFFSQAVSKFEQKIAKMNFVLERFFTDNYRFIIFLV